MKDINVSKYQEMADDVEKHLRKARTLLERLEAMTCEDADKGDKIAEQANPLISDALSHVIAAKADATKAGNLIPDVTVAFGGK